MKQYRLAFVAAGPLPMCSTSWTASKLVARPRVNRRPRAGNPDVLLRLYAHCRAGKQL